MYIYLINHM